MKPDPLSAYVKRWPFLDTPSKKLLPGNNTINRFFSRNEANNSHSRFLGRSSGEKRVSDTGDFVVHAELSVLRNNCSISGFSFIIGIQLWLNVFN